MKTLIELAKENGAIVEINKEWNNDKKLFETTNVIIATEAEHQATFDAYCKQLSTTTTKLEGLNMTESKSVLKRHAVQNESKPFNQDKSFRENCAKTQHNWVMDNNQIDVNAFRGTRGNPHQIHVGAVCWTCGYCACKHCEFSTLMNKCKRG